jgi:energy-converting hydrogenase Eha subunit E
MLEELRIIMETIGTATGAAKDFGILWLVIRLLETVLKYTLGAVAIFAAYRTIENIITRVSAASFATMIKDVIFPNSIGDSLRASEKKEIIKILNRAIRDG